MAHLRVLVVDDEPEICEALTDCLQGQGYQVVTTTRALQALELLRQQAFHIVILDLVLDPPYPSGLELLSQIRDIDSDLAIVVLTGHPSIDSASASVNHEASAYITKPFDVKDLLDVIDRITRRKGLVLRDEDAMLKTLGRTIRELRKKRNLTLKQVSRRTEISIALISQIERGESSASVSSLFRLAAALDVKLVELFVDP